MVGGPRPGERRRRAVLAVVRASMLSAVKAAQNALNLHVKSCITSSAFISFLLLASYASLLSRLILNQCV